MDRKHWEINQLAARHHQLEDRLQQLTSKHYLSEPEQWIGNIGQSLGGLTRDEATAFLEQFVKEAEKKPITLTSGDKTWEVLPADVGAQIDVAGAVSSAMGYTRDSNFVADVARRLVDRKHWRLSSGLFSATLFLSSPISFR